MIHDPKEMLTLVVSDKELKRRSMVARKQYLHKKGGSVYENRSICSSGLSCVCSCSVPLRPTDFARSVILTGRSSSSFRKWQGPPWMFRPEYWQRNWKRFSGQQLLWSTNPGRRRVLGTDAAVRAKKDGYTILITGTSALTFAPITSPESVHYDPAKDLEFLGLFYYFPNTITVRADSPWKTFPEFVDYAKKNPGKIRVSTTGVASGPHFVVEMIQSITGAQLTHVPFKGGESVVTAVLGGHVEATCDNIQKLKPHVDAGKLRFLLITDQDGRPAQRPDDY